MGLGAEARREKEPARGRLRGGPAAPEVRHRRRRGAARRGRGRRGAALRGLGHSAGRGGAKDAGGDGRPPPADPRGGQPRVGGRGGAGDAQRPGRDRLERGRGRPDEALVPRGAPALHRRGPRGGKRLHEPAASGPPTADPGPRRPPGQQVHAELPPGRLVETGVEPGEARDEGVRHGGSGGNGDAGLPRELARSPPPGVQRQGRVRSAGRGVPRAGRGGPPPPGGSGEGALRGGGKPPL